MKLKQIEKIGIIVFPEVEELEFIGIFEVLSRPKRLRLGKSFEIKIIGTKKKITCANGLKIIADEVYADLTSFDLLIVPGGKGTRELLNNKKFLDYLKSFGKNKFICSVCTGALLLGKAGFLKDKKATTHHLSFDALRPFCRKVMKQRIVKDGNVITSAGVSSSIDLGFYLLESILGDEVKTKVGEVLEYNP